MNTSTALRVSWGAFLGISVIAVASSVSPTIALNPTTLAFTGHVAGPNPQPAHVQLRNAHGSATTLNWTTDCSKPWLRVTPLSGTTQTEVDLLSVFATVNQTEAWTTPTSLANAPPGRENFSMVWTGKLMIVWGGTVGFNGAITNDGACYDPVTDAWVRTTSFVGAPSPRIAHSAIWTGTRMLVWGGRDNSTYYNDGFLYDPETDTWSGPISTVNAPSVRVSHSAVWTGTEMIVWGGYDGTELNNGGRYNAALDTWQAVNTVGAPSGRDDHVAVWTGTEMIVWSGYDGSARVNDGKLYHPQQNTWGAAISTVNAPPAVSGGSAVWDGSHMIVWGGIQNDVEITNLGGGYNPNSDSWQATTTTNALSARRSNMAVWIDGVMIEWGGYSPAGGFMNSGQRYLPPIALGKGSYSSTLKVIDPNASNSPQSVSVTLTVK